MRQRSWLQLVVVLAILSGACATDGGEVTETTEQATTTTVAPATTTTAPATTTTQPSESFSLDSVRVAFNANRDTSIVPDLAAWDAIVERGLALEIIPLTGAGADVTVAAVLADRADIGYASLAPLMAAVAQGQDLVAFLPAHAVPYHAVVAKDDIEEWSDLEGRTVGISSTTDSSYWSLVLVMEKYGADPEAVEWVTVRGSSDRAAALGAGRIDAGLVILGMGLPLADDPELDLHVLGYPGAEDENVLFTSYFTTREFAEQHPDVVAAFTEEAITQYRVAQDKDAFMALAIPMLVGVQTHDEISATYDALMEIGVWKPNAETWTEQSGDYTGELFATFDVLEDLLRFDDFATREFVDAALARLGPYEGS